VCIFSIIVSIVVIHLPFTKHFSAVGLHENQVIGVVCSNAVMQYMCVYVCIFSISVYKCV
jgi:hypothetical protein